MRRLLLAIALAAGACSGANGGDAGPADPTPPETSIVTTTIASSMATTLPGTSTTSIPEVPGALADFGVATIDVAGARWVVAVADTPDLRRRGLMGVTDLGDLDGMIFIFPETTTSGFWMKDTLIGLDIAFFDGDGVLVDQFGMIPCPGDPCPTYSPSGPYRYALEAPAGSLAVLEAGAVLSIEPS